MFLKVSIDKDDRMMNVQVMSTPDKPHKSKYSCYRVRFTERDLRMMELCLTLGYTITDRVIIGNMTLVPLKPTEGMPARLTKNHTIDARRLTAARFELTHPTNPAYKPKSLTGLISEAGKSDKIITLAEMSDDLMMRMVSSVTA